MRRFLDAAAIILFLFGLLFLAAMPTPVHSAECVSPPVAMARVSAAVRALGIVPDIQMRPDGRLMVVRIKGIVTNTFLFRGGCFVRPVEVPVLRVPRAEA